VQKSSLQIAFSSIIQTKPLFVSNTDATAGFSALVVDDDLTMVEYIARVLRRTGYDVHEAHDGMAALDICRAKRFDVIICDIRMPRLNGISFLRNLRRMDTHAKTPVIFASNLDDRSVRQEALSAGAEGVLLKPLSLQSIVDALAKIKRA
jgi:two-component system, chemotaxis family, chemotaxis protein CheY